MENLEEDVYAKKYLVNYRYISSEGKCASFSQDFECVNQDQAGDVNKNKSFTDREEENLSSSPYQTHESSSTKYILENVQPSSSLSPLSSKHSLSNGDHHEPRLKKFKHDCCELEEVDDAGLCSADVSELENLSNSESSLVMERFSDLSSQAELAWLSKVVAQDHAYNRRRGVQFGGVTVWYFGRQQYTSSIPSQGDICLGLDWTHSHSEHRQIDTDTDSEEEDNRRGKKKGGRLKRLKPLSLSARISLLRSHGILQIDRGESRDIERVQVRQNTLYSIKLSVVHSSIKC